MRNLLVLFLAVILSITNAEADSLDLFEEGGPEERRVRMCFHINLGEAVANCCERYDGISYSLLKLDPPSTCCDFHTTEPFPVPDRPTPANPYPPDPRDPARAQFQSCVMFGGI